MQVRTSPTGEVVVVVVAGGGGWLCFYKWIAIFSNTSLAQHLRGAKKKQKPGIAISLRSGAVAAHVAASTHIP